MMVSEHEAALHGRADVDGVTSKPVRNASIDWMRVASIWYVVGFWHLFGYVKRPPWSPEWEPVFFRLTTIVLALFLLISGYLIGRARVAMDAGSIWRFYRKRLLRIYPPYLAALAIFAAGGILGASPIKAALLVSMVSPPAPTTLWFVTMIMLFYLIAPFLIAAMKRPVQGIGVAAALWLVLFAGWRLTAAVDVRLLTYFPAFVTGLLLARVSRPRGALPMLALLVATALCYALSLHASAPADRSLWLAPVATSGALLIFIGLSDRLPENRAVAMLSGGSFFLYLFHRPIYTVLMKLVTATGHASVEVQFASLYLIGFPSAVAFGILGQRFYDAAIERRLGSSHATRDDRSPLPVHPRGN